MSWEQLVGNPIPPCRDYVGSAQDARRVNEAEERVRVEGDARQTTVSEAALSVGRIPGEPADPEELRVLPRLACRSGAGIPYISMENTNDASVGKWEVIFVVLGGEQKDVGMRTGIDGILVAPHVVCCVTKLQGLVLPKHVLPNLEMVAMAGWYAVFIFDSQTPRNEVSLEARDKVLVNHTWLVIDRAGHMTAYLACGVVVVVCKPVVHVYSMAA